MFGAMIGILFGLYVILAVINAIGVVVGAVFSGASFLLAEVFSGEGIAVGIAMYFLCFNRKKTAQCESDSEESADDGKNENSCSGQL